MGAAKPRSVLKNDSDIRATSFAAHLTYACTPLHESGTQWCAGKTSEKGTEPRAAGWSFDISMSSFGISFSDGEVNIATFQMGDPRSVNLVSYRSR